MSFTLIKEKLWKDRPLLISVLEDYGIHHIKSSRKYIQGALPDGDNPHSFSLNIKTEALYVKIYTRGNFKGKDIFDGLAFISNKTVSEVLKSLSDKLGIKYNYNTQIEKKSDLLSTLSSMIRYDKMSGNYHTNKEIDDSKLEMFIHASHAMFLNDGIDSNTQTIFEICYDVLENRIIIPIRNDNGKLVTMKGRIAVKDVPQNTPKYLAYEPYNADSILYGLYQNKKNIIKLNEVIISEAEKSVLQAHTIGVNNVIALSKKVLSEAQRKKILELQVPVVIALDNDVPEDEIILMANEFIDYTTVYIIRDKNRVLSQHDSPFDNGEIIWDDLYSNKIKFERGMECLN